MHGWSCPLSGAEIYFSTVKLLMVAVSASGAVLFFFSFFPYAEMCYCQRPFSRVVTVLAGSVGKCAIIPAVV